MSSRGFVTIATGAERYYYETCYGRIGSSQRKSIRLQSYVTRKMNIRQNLMK